MAGRSVLGCGSCSKQPCGLRGAALVQCGADGMDETAYARAFQTSRWGRSTKWPALSEPMKLSSEARIRRWALVSCLGRLWRPASHPTSPFFCGNCAHFIKYALASVQMRVKAARDAESSPGGSSSNALGITIAELAEVWWAPASEDWYLPRILLITRRAVCEGEPLTFKYETYM